MFVCLKIQLSFAFGSRAKQAVSSYSAVPWCRSRCRRPARALLNAGEVLPHLQETSFSNRVQPHVCSRFHKGKFFTQLGKARVCASRQTDTGSTYGAASAEGRALLSCQQQRFSIKEGGRDIRRELIHL